MSKLIISGKKSYTTRMKKHLLKEHPSTRHRMIIRDKIGNIDVEHPKTISYCEMCGKRMNKRIWSTKSINMCRECLNKELRGLK